MKSTMDRQISLVRKFGFVCRCKRCEDPIELGNFVGSPLCLACAKNGKHQNMVVGGDATYWQCERCREKTKLPDFLAKTSDLLEKLARLEDECADYKKWLAFLKQVQHPNGPLHSMHSAVLRAKDKLRHSLYACKAKQGESQVAMQVWEDVCRDLLAAMDALCPGLHEGRLEILLELRHLLIKRAVDAQSNALAPAEAPHPCDLNLNDQDDDAIDSAFEEHFSARTLAGAASKVIYDVFEECRQYLYGDEEKDDFLYRDCKGRH